MKKNMKKLTDYCLNNKLVATEKDVESAFMICVCATISLTLILISTIIELN